ncbi:MAG: alpha/beta fold hydrolase [Planctomycetaceae bacterium]
MDNWKRNRRLATLCLGMLLFSTAASFAQEKKLDPVEVLTTKEGIRFGIWPAKPKEPAPVLIVLANSIEGTLGDEYFRMAGNSLSQKGYFCVTIDLPCHGQEQRPDEPAGLDGWRHRLENDDNFVAETNKKLSAVLDHLIDAGWADKDRIAAIGTSRGGFMATHFAAAEPRVRCVAAIAPVADLTDLREFVDVKNKDLVDQLALEHLAEKLAGRGVWMIIGDRDDRVNTDRTVALARRLTSKSLELGKPALVDLYVISEPQGHTTPRWAWSCEQAADWIERHLTAEASSAPSQK